MKKFILSAALLLGVTAAFAGDSDPLKAILKAETYTQASQLIEQNVGQLTDNAEKAKAYNHLAELALKDYNAQASQAKLNQDLDKLGKPDQKKKVDSLLMFNSAENALKAAQEVAKFDMLPNAKGKVKPKFESISESAWVPFIEMLNGTFWAAQTGQDAKGMEYGKAYFDAETSDFFNGISKERKDVLKPYRGQLARIAAVLAYRTKNYEEASKLCDEAMKDSAEFKNALNLKVLALGANLKTAEDSVAYAGKLKTLLTQYPDNEVIIEKLYNSYSNKEEARKMLEGVLAQHPDNFVALVEMGQSYVAANDGPNAVKYLRLAVDANPNSAIARALLGSVLNVLASNANVKATRDAYFDEAIKQFDKAKELDPYKEQAKWGYNRYQAYYGRYGANDPKTKEAELDK